mgnify:CR=1 FL=1
MKKTYPFLTIQKPKLTSLKIAHKILYYVIFCCFPYTFCQASNGIEGYLSNFSVERGQSLNLYTSTTAPTFDLQIFHNGTHWQSVKKFTNLQGTYYSTPNNAWSQGAQWLNPVKLQTGSNWSGGLYTAVIKTKSYSKQLSFAVRENTPGTKSKILLLDNATTQVAYNNWGGKSLYTFNSSDHIKAYELSLFRPGQNTALRQQREFIAWAEHKNIPIEYASTMDLNNHPSLLNNYDTVVLAGHSEYWTKGMRNAYDSFVQNGGNAMILGGNTMWWQIRLDGNQQTGYKNAAYDPLYGTNNDLVTTNWYKAPVNDPENRSTGVSWRNGGYVNSQGFLPASQGYGGYTVTDASNWVYDGTNLKNGDTLGQKNAIVGYETDGALFTIVNGKPVVTGTDGTPLDFKILGYSPAHTGNATMGIFQVPSGGTVFNAATVNWADGLWNFNNATVADNNVSTMTYNMLKRFSASVVPVPPAIYLFISGLITLVGFTGKTFKLNTSD